MTNHHTSGSHSPAALWMDVLRSTGIPTNHFWPIMIDSMEACLSAVFLMSFAAWLGLELVLPEKVETPKEILSFLFNKEAGAVVQSQQSKLALITNTFLRSIYISPQIQNTEVTK
ncbi:phosphoribosylformylglycinamidine synthase [Puccinia sorghi]|uniref:Phosphoribosylformylglycinamidine synthase n=1 Tax=Puccinia sorghi TaxID=27349 RepID=A0A0L6VAP0_9BASI|nr:phosphoribosylformylglycinamidine synthase [Puccinia sorghi]